ncbi:MAG: hypothetical protein AAFV80_10885, partial [Bacteroidota bacterium]
AYSVIFVQNEKEPLLQGIQDRVYQEFVQCLINRSPENLEELDRGLQSAYTESPQNLILYWRSYLDFYHAIYYLKQSDSKQADQLTDQAIQRLEGMNNKNAEDLALLARLQGFAIQFNKLGTIRLSAKSKKNAETALLVDDQNPRAHFVLASNDYYTPEKYGGGKLVEQHLQEAIALPAQAIENSMLPSWGKEESYELLIKWYIRKQQYEEATATFQAGIQAFPDSYTLKQLATQLVGK